MRLAEFIYHELGPIRIDGPSRFFRRFVRAVAEGMGWGLGLGLGLALAALIFCWFNGIDAKLTLEQASRWSNSSASGDRSVTPSQSPGLEK